MFYCLYYFVLNSSHYLHHEGQTICLKACYVAISYYPLALNFVLFTCQSQVLHSIATWRRWFWTLVAIQIAWGFLDLYLHKYKLRKQLRNSHTLFPAVQVHFTAWITQWNKLCVFYSCSPLTSWKLLESKVISDLDSNNTITEIVSVLLFRCVFCYTTNKPLSLTLTRWWSFALFDPQHTTPHTKPSFFTYFVICFYAFLCMNVTITSSSSVLTPQWLSTLP